MDEADRSGFGESSGVGVSQQIHLSPPDIGELEEAALIEALRSGWVAPAGPMIDAFEVALAQRCGRRCAVALSSGTAALHLGLLGLGAGPGSVVLVPTMTFVATANAVSYTGAEPIFVDCDRQGGNLDPELTERTLRDLGRQGRAVAAVVAVDLLGRCADYAALTQVCEQFEVPILSDAAESLGSSYRGRPAGSFGTSAALSFNGNKVMTTGGGGALLTDDVVVADRARYLSSQARQPTGHYEHTEIGYNYRLSNLLAAVGVAQLQRLDAMIERRRSVRAGYAEVFADAPGVQIFQREGDAEDNCWLTAVLIDRAGASWKPGDLAAALQKRNIESRPLWKPMHMQPVFERATRVLNGNAAKLFATGLALPSGSALSQADIGRIHETISEFIAMYR
jgi:dTDP-4-amino-4,6-dideoxygalactose transaminase